MIPTMQQRTEQLAFRVTPEEKQAIQARTEQAGLTMTRYLVAAALGDKPTAAKRLSIIEQRLAELEGSGQQ